MICVSAGREVKGVGAALQPLPHAAFSAAAAAPSSKLIWLIRCGVEFMSLFLQAEGGSPLPHSSLPKAHCEQ